MKLFVGTYMEPKFTGRVIEVDRRDIVQVFFDFNNLDVCDPDYLDFTTLGVMHNVLIEEVHKAVKYAMLLTNKGIWFYGINSYGIGDCRGARVSDMIELEAMHNIDLVEELFASADMTCEEQ